MDNITLNEEQLWQLRQFIMKRGIKEVDVVHEILDHFACKVEEILSAEKNIPFERAIQLAHQSFGASGFRPLVAQYEKHVEQIMWTVFKHEIKRVLSSPKIIFLIAFGLIVIPILHFFANKIGNHWFLEMEYLSYIFIILSSSIYYAVIFRDLKWKVKDRNGKTRIPYLWQRTIFGIPRVPIFPIIIGIISAKLVAHNDPIHFAETKLFSIIIAVFMVITLIRIMAQYQTYLAMEKRFGHKLQIG